MAKFATKIAKGWKRDGNFREITPAKKNPQNPYTNPAKAKRAMAKHPGTKPVTKKMGSN